MDSLERIKEEYNDILANLLPNIGCCVSLPNLDNFYEWNINYLAPKDSFYTGGLFSVKILFPKNYPNEKPEVIFLTPIYHLNVNPINDDQPIGFACLNIINWWRPENTIREVLVQIYSLFYWQNPDTPYGIDRAMEYVQERPLFELKAKYFTQKYANLKNGLQQFDGKKWNFSCSEKDLEPIKLKEQEEKEKESEKETEKDQSKEDINLDFTYNGKTKTTIQCGTNELMKNVIEKYMNKLGKSENLEKILLIFHGKKIDFNSSVKDIGLENNSNISIILDEYCPY